MGESDSSLNRVVWLLNLIGILFVAGYIAMHATLASRDVVSIFFGSFLCTLVCFIYLRTGMSSSLYIVATDYKRAAAGS